MTFLDHLKADQAQISTLIQAHREQVQGFNYSDLPVETLHQMYIETMDDALSMLKSMIDHLSNRP
jgi:hypothetical protein